MGGDRFSDKDHAQLKSQRALPAPILSQSSDSTSRLGRNTEGTDAQSRSGAGCEPARKHRPRPTFQIASGMRPLVSEILGNVPKLRTIVKVTVTDIVRKGDLEFMLCSIYTELQFALKTPTAMALEAGVVIINMSIEKLNLRKLLQLFFADDRLRRSLLLKDIRDDLTKADGGRNSGGDFYGPFWSDVKDHIAGRLDLPRQTKARVAANNSRARLYPILKDCFLSMWNEKMRWRNEPFEFVPESVKAQLPIEQLRATVKIENTAAIKTWDGSYRVIYPYFSEAPALPEEGARLGFWALNEALPDYRIEDLRIIDLQRQNYFRPKDVGIKGNEREQFLKRYDSLLREWQMLKNKR
jgi:hypothetical protein